MTDLFEFIQVVRRVTENHITTDEIDDYLMIGSSQEAKQKRKRIKKAIISPNLNKNALIDAIKNKVDLILVHNFEEWEKSLVDENLATIKHLLENNIMIYKIPDSWIYCEGGLNHTIANILKFEMQGIFNIKIGGKNLPYGRICSPFKSQIRYSLLLDLISDKLGLKNFQYVLVNDGDDIVNKCVILTGINVKIEWLGRAKIKEIDLFVGNGLNYSIARFSESIEMNFIDLTFDSIRLGLSRFSKIMSIECPDVEFIEPTPSFPLRFFFR